MAQPVKLGQHEVDVLLSLRLVRDDGPEEVGQIPQRLVTDHHASTFHHPSLNIEENLITICHRSSHFLFDKSSKSHSKQVKTNKSFI